MDLLYLLFFIMLGSNFSSMKVESLKSEKIIDGILAPPVSFKYIVAVIYRVNKTYYENPCTGAIISDWFIATAAHCFYNKTNGKYINKLFEIIVSSVNLRKPTFLTRHIRVEFVYMPKDYQPNELDIYSTKGDLAIVKLSGRLGFSNHRTTIKDLLLPKQALRGLNNLYKVAGYGWHEFDAGPDIIEGAIEFLQTGRTDRRLRYATALILPNEECESIIKDKIAEGNMCARVDRRDPNKPSGICQFDSGAPLVHGNYLDGIAINGFMECDEEKFPGIYIKHPSAPEKIHFVQYLEIAVYDWTEKLKESSKFYSSILKIS